jgi:hypothetical protein
VNEVHVHQWTNVCGPTGQPAARLVGLFSFLGHEPGPIKQLIITSVKRRTLPQAAGEGAEPAKLSRYNGHAHDHPPSAAQAASNDQ